MKVRDLALKWLCFPLLTSYALWAFGAVDSQQHVIQRQVSLLDAYNLARESDPSLAIAEYRIDVSEAQRDVSRGGFFPQISLFGDWSENRIRYEGALLGQPSSQEYPGERYGLQLKSPLLNMRAIREYERQKFLVDQSKEELAVAETRLIADVVTAFLSVLLAEETVKHLKTEVSALERQLEQAEALYAKALLPVTQVLETQSRVDALLADLVFAEGRAAIANEKLSQIVGFEELELQPVVERLSLIPRVGDANGAAMLAAEVDPATLAAEKAVSAAQKGVAREKGSWWPEIDFVYNNQYSDVGFDNLTSPPRSSESYAISVRYPLFEGGAGAARLRRAQAEYYTALQQLEVARRQASGRARAAWVSYEAATERLRASLQAAKTSSVNLDAARKAVQAGTARLSDVLLALAQNTRAQRDLSEAKFQRAIGWLELELSTGRDPFALAPELSEALHGQ